MPINDQSSPETPSQARGITDMPGVKGLLAALGLALPFVIGAHVLGQWLVEKDEAALVKLTEAALTPASVMVGAAWVAITLAGPAEAEGDQRVRRDDLLYTALLFTIFAVAAVALALLYTSSHAHLGGAADDVGIGAVTLMGLVLGGVLQLMIRALWLVLPTGGKAQTPTTGTDTGSAASQPEDAAN